MAIKSYYGEELYFRDHNVILTETMEETIRLLLSQNHGVGILGGFYAPGLPVTLASKLTLDLLGYHTMEEFNAACDKGLLHLFWPDAATGLTEESFYTMAPVSERQLCTSDGRPLWVRVVRSDWSEAQGEKMWLLSLCDIDLAHRHEQSLIKAKEEADQANAAKTIFLSRMSHDIRTPMNGIMGMAHIARENAHDPKVVVAALDKITSAGKQLKLLLDEVLDMSQLENGRIELLHEPFHLGEQILDIFALVSPLSLERRVELAPPQFLHTHDNVLGSALHLRRVLENLLTNATKYTLAGGHVTLQVEEDPLSDTRSFFRFTVRDTGIGMSKAFQVHMFEPFSREEHDIEGLPGGTGLGLSITKDLVDLMGGEIDVDSAPGQGTTFTVTIPMDLSEGSLLPEAEEADALPAQPLAGMRILMAEDNALNREIAEYTLENAGATVDTCEDGKLTLEAFLASPPGQYDLILMDIMMPVMNGLDAAKAIRASDHPQAGTIPIVAMTANAFSSDVRAALAAGMNAHIAKPVDMVVLTKTLRAFRSYRA